MPFTTNAPITTSCAGRRSYHRLLYVYVCMYVCTYVCVHACCVWMQSCVFVCSCFKCVFKCVYVCIYVYMHNSHEDSCVWGFTCVPTHEKPYMVCMCISHTHNSHTNMHALDSRQHMSSHTHVHT